ncbi:MAG: hemerythrin family protein [Halobacteriovoraceae bacterium]|nr:hemerythrin family protein [Halobacteriovoraceae bacterium]
MPYVEWNDELVTGSQVIDYQHKRLVGLINDLYEIQEKDDFKEELIEVVINELKYYAKFHFSTEEKILNQINHIDIDKHKLKHRSFEKTLDFFLQKRKQHESIQTELFEFLKDWLVNHIKVEDKKAIETLTNGIGLV